MGGFNQPKGQTAQDTKGVTTAEQLAWRNVCDMFDKQDAKCMDPPQHGLKLIQEKIGEQNFRVIT